MDFRECLDIDWESASAADILPGFDLWWDAIDDWRITYGSDQAIRKHCCSLGEFGTFADNLSLWLMRNDIDPMPVWDLFIEIENYLDHASDTEQECQTPLASLGQIDHLATRAVLTLRFVADLAGNGDKPAGRNSDRDEWIYKSMCSGCTAKEMVGKLRNEHPEWDFVETPNAIHNVIRNYCLRTGKPRPSRVRSNGK